MSTARLEAFSDGVIAVIITIMVLELKVPHGSTLEALAPLVPTFLTYILSFVYLGIYWTNHHHLLHVTEGVNGAILWANLHLLFWLSFTPFVTGWMGDNHAAAVPTAAYGCVMFMAALGWTILQRTIIVAEGPRSRLATAVGGDRKGKISAALYLSAIPLAFVRPWIADGIYVTVALIWLVPDRRIESTVAQST
jgi:uncharacterized membrane protein